MHQRGHPGMCTHSTHGVLSKSITPFTTLCEIYPCGSQLRAAHHYLMLFTHNRHVSEDNANYVSVMCVCICAVAHIITLHIQVLIACLWASLSNIYIMHNSLQRISWMWNIYSVLQFGMVTVYSICTLYIHICKFCITVYSVYTVSRVWHWDASRASWGDARDLRGHRLVIVSCLSLRLWRL